MNNVMQFNAVVEEDQAYIMRAYGRYPIALVKGRGAHVWDVDGKEYVDLLAGIAVASLGHCNEELVDVLTEQANSLWHVSNLVYQDRQVELAKKLVATTGHLEKVFYCNSGTEAVESLIKLARRYMARVKRRPEAVEIITLDKCYHGRTYGALSATGRENYSDGFQPLPVGFRHVPAGDIGSMRRAIGRRTCAVLVEVVQGEGGAIVLDDDYVREVERLCRENDVLFCCDEVQAGMCRTGAFWGYQTCGVKPDIVSVAKALANGLPMGAILSTDEVAQAFEPGSHGATFGGNPLVSAVASKTVDIMLRDDLASRAKRLGDHVLERVRACQESHPGSIQDVRGKGLFIGIELGEKAKDVWASMLEKGFIVNLSHGTTLRLLPPLVIEEEDLDAFVDALEESLSESA